MRVRKKLISHRNDDVISSCSEPRTGSYHIPIGRVGQSFCRWSATSVPTAQCPSLCRLEWTDPTLQRNSKVSQVLSNPRVYSTGSARKVRCHTKCKINLAIRSIGMRFHGRRIAFAVNGFYRYRSF